MYGYIDRQHWPAKRGKSKPTLTVTYEALRDMLQEECGVLDADDVPALCKALAERVATNEGSDELAVADWIELADYDIDALDEGVMEDEDDD